MTQDRTMTSQRLIDASPEQVWRARPGQRRRLAV